MIRFPDVFGTTDEFRNRVYEQGFMDIEAVRPEDVLDAEYDRKWLPDFRQVFAIINIAGEQGDFNSILLMANKRLIKCRLSPNVLIKRLKLQFVLDAHADVGGVAKIVGVKKFVPYVCGDFLLVPVGKRNASNNSWVRVYTSGEIWEYIDLKSLIHYPSISVVRIPHSEQAMIKRRGKCLDILRYYQKTAACISTTIALPDELSEKEVRDFVTRKNALNLEQLSRKLAG